MARHNICKSGSDDMKLSPLPKVMEVMISSYHRFHYKEDYILLEGIKG